MYIAGTQWKHSRVELDNFHSMLQILLQASPTFWKFAFCHFVFTKDLLVPVLPSQKKPEEDFRFYRKRQRAKTVLSICFASSLYRGSKHLKQVEWPPKLLCQKPHSASQHQATIALNYVSEHLSFILILCCIST